jgi:hypothetical protein
MVAEVVGVMAVMEDTVVTDMGAETAMVATEDTEVEEDMAAGVDMAVTNRKHRNYSVRLS